MDEHTKSILVNLSSVKDDNVILNGKHKRYQPENLIDTYTPLSSGEGQGVRS
jgi:hypothetical protein